MGAAVRGRSGRVWERAVAVRGSVSAPTPCVHALVRRAMQAARPALVLRVAARKMAALTKMRRGRGGEALPCGAQHHRVDEVAGIGVEAGADDCWKRGAMRRFTQLLEGVG